MQDRWDEVNKMEPGDDFDKMIAEKVMKWQSSDAIPNEYTLPLFVNGEVTYESQPFKWIKFAPSTDISSAWYVVDQMRKLGNEVNLWIYEHHRGIRCMIQDASHGPQYSFKGKTAPEAICKAALLAIMP